MRSRSAQALTDGIKRLWPNATVWGKGDAAHQGSPSDHNEDDTPGSRPEQQDDDNVPEHRAVDVPRLGGVTMSNLRTLRERLTTRPANQRRLRYVILEQYIWRKRNGWERENYSGDFHDHLHASVDVADDDNAAPYDLGEQGGDDEVSEIVEKAARLIEAQNNGMQTTTAGENVETVKWRIRDENWQKKVDERLAELAARPVADITVAGEDLEAAIERVMRRVLGSLDGQQQ